MEGSEAEHADIDILHPELLPNKTLIKLLSDRNVKTLGLEHLERQKIVDLYYKHVLPQPQRKYRQNRRGQVMTRQQIIMNKQKRSHSEMSGGSGDGANQRQSTQKNYTVANAPKSGLINSFSPSAATERLKPPPSAINFEKKVIKLGGGSVKVTSQLDSLSIKSPSTKIKLIKSPELAEVIKSPNGSSTSNGTNPSKPSDAPTVKITKILPQKLLDPKPGKKIRLKRPGHFEVPSESHETSTEMDTDTSQTKQEIQETLTGSIEKTESERQTEDAMEVEEEVPAKKFKRVNVQWP